MTGKDYDYTLNMLVRDYECDLEGIVNNANYLHYLEHTRHQYLLGRGISFVQLHKEGIDLVVARINIAYKAPLSSGDEFISCLNMKKEGLKYIFYQDIYRLKDSKLCIKAKVDSVSIIQGKLGNFAPLANLLQV